MKCAKCNIDFPEIKIELSHDIPKYLGGKDSDGRHWLCKTHHRQYEFRILSSCLNFLGENLKEGEETMWMMELKNCNEKLKEKFRNFAQEIKQQFFKNDSKTTAERGN